MNSNRFLFYNNSNGAPDGWGVTLAVLEQGDYGDVQELARRLVSFASQFSLSGNVWQHWLTYVLMIHENPFTLACERRAVRRDSAMMQLAQADMDAFAGLFRAEPVCKADSELLGRFTDYDLPYVDCKDHPGYAGERIMDLSRKLAAAAGSSDSKEPCASFAQAVMDHYERYGIGIYGLYKAFRIAEGRSEMQLVPVTDGTDVSFDDLIGYEDQKKILRDNTEAFVNGLPANNVLLYGDSGTGKSTSIHALMHDFSDRGLRLVEITKPGRRLLPQVLSEIKKRNYRFIIFLDDLSFEENESDYKELKAMLEGALEARTDRVLIYATSNRRHLIRETWRDRSDMEYEQDIHHSDTMEEKLSLASRFGVMIYYSKPDAKEYLGIVRALAERQGLETDAKELEDAARKWELRHGGMTGRAARQFITWLESGAAGE